jgi:four helix bundle protein
MEKIELEKRAKTFAIQVIHYVAGLPKCKEGDVIRYQLLRSATSIGANYREANRTESRADFIHKIALVEKEAAETQYRLELCRETQLLNCDGLDELQRETSELLAIFTRIGKTSKGRR